MQIREEDGFTLIELLVVIAILSILAGLSFESFSLVRTRAYRDISSSALYDARVALHAGVDDLEGEPAAWHGGWQNSAGDFVSWTGVHLLPGYVNQEGVEITAFHNSWCDQIYHEWCLVEGITTRHCKGDRRLSWMRFQNGVEMTSAWESPPTC